MNPLLLIPIVFAILALAVLLLGAIPLCVRDTTIATLGHGMAHGLGGVSLLVLFGVAIPRAMQVFQGFDVELPAAMGTALWIGDLLVRLFCFAAPLLVALLAADVFVFQRSHRVPETRAVAIGLSCAGSAILAGSVLLVVLAVAIPLIRLINDLQ